MARMIACSVLLLLCLPHGLLAAEGTRVSIGVVVSMQGDAGIQGRDTREDLQALERVFIGETVRTGDDGQAKLQLDDGTVLLMGRNTELRVRQFAYDLAVMKRIVDIDLVFGTVRASVESPKLEGQSITIQTTAGDIVADSCDVFITVPDGADSTQITVLSGEVQVQESYSQAGALTTIGLRQSSVLRLDGGLTPPVSFSDDTARAMLTAVDLIPLDLLQEGERLRTLIDENVADIQAQTLRLYDPAPHPVYGPTISLDSFERAQGRSNAATPESGDLTINFILPVEDAQ